MPTPKKPEIKDYADFMSKINDDNWKEYIWSQLQFIQKERHRLREKSKRQREKRREQGVKVEASPGTSA